MELDLDNEGVVEEDGELEATCRITASFPPVIELKWFINDVEIADARNKETVTLENIQQQKDETVLKCRATNVIGSSEQTRRVTVHRKPRITKQPETKYALKGETVSFSCLAEGGSTNPHYVWLKSGSEELAGVGETLSLTVSESTEDDYICNAIFGEVILTSRTARLVMRKELIVEAETMRTSVPGKDVVLHCGAKNAYPGSVTSWTRNGRPLKGISGNKYKFVEDKDEDSFEISSNLIITDVVGEDFAVYGCAVRNEFSSAEARIELVQGEESKDSYLTITLALNIIGGIMIFVP